MAENVVPPEAKLIAERREVMQPKMSQNAAGKSIGISGNRWRHIEKGYQTVAAGVTAPVVAPADTLARMAQLVGVTPEELETVGRTDAAQALRVRQKAAAPAVEPTQRRSVVDLDKNDGDLLKTLSELLETGEITANARATLEGLRDDVIIERFPELYDSLSDAGKLKVAHYGHQVKREEMEYRHADPSPTAPESDPSQQGHQDQEVTSSLDQAQTTLADFGQFRDPEPVVDSVHDAQ